MVDKQLELEQEARRQKRALEYGIDEFLNGKISQEKDRIPFVILLQEKPNKWVTKISNVSEEKYQLLIRNAFKGV